MKKLSYEYVREYIKSFGYVLLSKEYKNNRTKLQMKCDNNHEFEMTLDCFQQGWRCSICKIEKQKLSYEQVKEYVGQRGLDILLSEEYKNNNTKLQFQCKKDKNVYEMRWGNYQQGSRCPICGGNVKLSYEQVKQHVEQRGMDTLLSKEYKNSRTKLKFQCKKDKNVYEMTWGNYQQGKRCPVCFYNSTSSKAEQEIQEYIASIYTGTIVNNDRNTIINDNTGCYLELDVYLPELKKAIEYNGVYWHSLPNSNDKIKQKQCKNKNIDLLVIDEGKYINNKEKYLKKIEKFIKEK